MNKLPDQGRNSWGQLLIVVHAFLVATTIDISSLPAFDDESHHALSMRKKDNNVVSDYCLQNNDHCRQLYLEWKNV